MPMKKKNFLVKSIAIIVLLLLVSVYTHAQERPKVELISSGELILKGIKYYDKEDYDKAIDTYKKVSKNDTNYSWALYELGSAYTAQKNYDLAIESAKQGLKLFDKSNEVDFYIQLGNAYDYLDSTETALNYYKEALSIYPQNQSLIYNSGLALYQKKDYNEAEKTMIRSLTINPYHPNSHLYLGYINIIKGRFLQAVLCFNTALLMAPSEEKGSFYLSKLEQAYSGELEKKLKENAMPPEGEVNSNYQDIETLIKSDFALNKKYKTEAKLGYIAVKQAQLIFDQLKPDKEQKDFYTRFYVPLFRFIADEGYIEPFSYYIMQSVDNENVQSWITSKQSKIKKFTSACGGFISDKRKFGFDPENEKSKKVYYYFSENNTLNSFGSFEDKKEKVRTGEWIFYYQNGTLETKATYEKGKLNGSSTFFTKEHSIEKVLNYVNDEIEGKAVFYNIYGEKHSELNVKNSNINGAANYFNSSGYPEELRTYVDGKVKGPGKLFYNNGQLKQEYTKIDDKFNGPAKTYYADGSVEMVATLKDGKLNGAYVNYYSNGNKESEGKIVNGDRVGKWTEYYSTGKLKSETTYSDKGKTTGTVKNYYLDGTLESELNYGSNGKMDGKCSYYDFDGKLYNEVIYRNDKFDEVIFYDKSGKNIKDAVTKKGVLAMDFVYPNGAIRYSGTFKDGEEEGQFKYYNANGVLTSDQNYKKGRKHGKYNIYYANGKVKETGGYLEGKLDGYLTHYHENGIISDEGWYKDGRLQGDWYQYHSNGTIACHSYYVNGENHGFIEYYNPNGRKYLEQFYNYGLFLRNTQFDSLGNIYNDCELKAGKGKLKKLNMNGTLYEQSEMIMGNKYDTVKAYNINGTLTYTGFVIDGERHGVCKSYNDDGKLITEKSYVLGQQYGMEKTYEDDQLSTSYEYIDGELENTGKVYKDGKLKMEINYKKGDRNGYTTVYAPEGQVAYRMLYMRGNFISYSYLDKTGKYVAEIPIVDGKAKVVAYFQNGKKSVEFEIVNGERNGLKIDYYPDGKVREEYNYLNGQYHGSTKEYYATGKLRREAEYKYDDITGTLKLYNTNGTLKREVTYIDGQCHGIAKYYNQTGKLTKTRTYYYDTLINE